MNTKGAKIKKDSMRAVQKLGVLCELCGEDDVEA